MAEIMMSLSLKSEFFGHEAIKVKFEEVPEPITADDLVRYFYRFALACGYSERTMGDSMIGIGEEMSTSKKIYDSE